MVQAKPALVEASALNPICASAFAEPMSKGFGIGKQPLSCSLRNVARLSANEIGIGVSPFVVRIISVKDYASAAPHASDQNHHAVTMLPLGIAWPATLRPCAGR